MKTILLSLLIVGFCLTANADYYVFFDKETGECLGVSSISQDTVIEKAKQYILKQGDETYRGKQGYEIKFENGKLRHATKAEKDTYKAEKKAEQDTKRKADALELIGLTEDDIAKIKNIQIAMSSGSDTSIKMVTPAFIQWGKILFGFIVSLIMQ